MYHKNAHAQHLNSNAMFWIRRFLWCTMIQTDLGSLIRIRIPPKERSLKWWFEVLLQNYNHYVLIFFRSVCQNLYNRLCSLWDDYCQPKAYRFVKENVVDRYRYSCPVTCGKCRPGQKMLDSSTYSKYRLLYWQTLVLSIQQKIQYRTF